MAFSAGDSPIGVPTSRAPTATFRRPNHSPGQSQWALEAPSPRTSGKPARPLLPIMANHVLWSGSPTCVLTVAALELPQM